MGKLHELCRSSNDGATIEKAIRLHADALDEKDKMNTTPLMYAARYGHDVTVSMLLDAGAAINATNLKRQTALYQAVVGEHPSIVSAMLNREADPNMASDTGYTTLHYAAKMGLSSSMRALLEGGADHTATTEEGHTALFLAAKYERMTCEALLEAFAATGTCSSVGDVDLATADDMENEDAELMRELEEMEVHPDLQKVKRVKEFKAPGNLPKANQSAEPAAAAPTATDDNYGKVSVGGPTPDMMMQKSGGRSGGSGGARPAAEMPTPAPAPPVVAAPKEPAYATVDKSKKTPKPAEVVVPEQTYMDGEEAGSRYDNREANSDIKDTGKDGTYAVPETYETGGNGNGDGYSVPEPFKSKLRPDEEPDYASVDEVLDTPAPPLPAVRLTNISSVPTSTAGSEMTTFLTGLGLFDKCKALADEAGIDEPADFKMFTEGELVGEHKFKVGHVRKILMALGNADC